MSSSSAYIETHARPSRIPPTGVGGCLQVLPTSRRTRGLPNPTHGSGWMFSSSAYIEEARAASRIPPTAVGGCFQGLACFCRTRPSILGGCTSNRCQSSPGRISFRTHRRKKLFATGDRAANLSASLAEICERHDYHLLKSRTYPDHVRCLLSLRPSQSTSKTMQTIKSNLSRAICSQYGLNPPMWGIARRSCLITFTSWCESFLDRDTSS
jgi:REP element-mobilizing transposase RayT